MKRIKLTKGYETLVDDSDFESLNQWKWCYGGQGRAMRRIKGQSKTIYMHRVITNCPEDKEVDHINGNPLDNSRSNLRVCNRLQNAKNLSLYRNNTTGHKGIYWYEKTKRWQTYIAVDKIPRYLGVYKTKEEAAKAYDLASIKYHGVFGRGNFA